MARRARTNFNPGKKDHICIHTAPIYTEFQSQIGQSICGINDLDTVTIVKPYILLHNVNIWPTFRKC